MSKYKTPDELIEAIEGLEKEVEQQRREIERLRKRQPKRSSIDDWMYPVESVDDESEK